MRFIRSHHLILVLLAALPSPSSGADSDALVSFCRAWDELGDRLRRSTDVELVQGAIAANRLAAAATCLGTSVRADHDAALRLLAEEVLAAARSLGAEPVESLQLSLALREELPRVLPRARPVEPCPEGVPAPKERAEADLPSVAPVLAALRADLLGDRLGAPR